MAVVTGESRMGLDMRFVTVPISLQKDGDWHSLLLDPSEGLAMKEGVQELPFSGSCHTYTIGSVSNGCLADGTGGLWVDFLSGGPLSWDSNGRYIMLSPRGDKMVRLKEYIPTLPERHAGQVRTVIEACEDMIRRYGGSIALLIT